MMDRFGAGRVVKSVDSLGANQSNLPRGERQAVHNPYSALQLLFLLRLGFLLQRRRQYQKLVDGDDWRLRLLSKAIYSTYRDCVALGNEIEAKSLFRTPAVEAK